MTRGPKRKDPRHTDWGLSHESIAECNRRGRRADGVWLQSEWRQVIVAQRNFCGAGQEIVDQNDQAGEQTGRRSLAERSGLGHFRTFRWCGKFKSTRLDDPKLRIPDAIDGLGIEWRDDGPLTHPTFAAHANKKTGEMIAGLLKFTIRVA